MNNAIVLGKTWIAAKLSLLQLRQCDAVAARCARV
jgi:hypothetical protein